MKTFQLAWPGGSRSRPRTTLRVLSVRGRVTGWVVLSLLFGMSSGCDRSSSSGGGPVPSSAAPVVASDSVSTSEDTSVVFSPLDNDSGSGLTIVQLLMTDGILTELPGGQLRFDPAANFFGVAIGSYEVRDGQGRGATASIEVTVTPEPDAPLPAADIATVSEDSSALLDVLSNDLEVDGESLVISIATPPTLGTVSPSGDQLLYEPNADACGSDSFVYQVEDSTGLSATAQVDITIDCVDDPPAANPDSASVLAGFTILIDVLANDVDPDGDVVDLIGLDTLPGLGIASIVGDRIEYVAGPATGIDTFSYRVVDPSGLQSIGLVDVDVRDYELTFRLNSAAPTDYSPSSGPTPIVIAQELDWDSPAGLLPSVTSIDQSWRYIPTEVSIQSVVPGLALDPTSGGFEPTLFLPTIGVDTVTVGIEFDRFQPLVLSGTAEIAVTTAELLATPGNPYGVDTLFEWSPTGNSVDAAGISLTPVFAGDSVSLDPAWGASEMHFLLPAQVQTYDPADLTPQFIEQPVALFDRSPTVLQISAVSFGIAHPVGAVVATDLSMSDSIASLNGGSGPDFFAGSIYNDGVTLGMVVSFPLVETVSYEQPGEIARVTYAVDPAALGGASPAVIPIGFVDTLGAPTVDTVVLVDFVQIAPTQVDGRLTFIAE